MYSRETRESVIRYYNVHKNSPLKSAYVDNIQYIWKIGRSTFYKWLSLYREGKLNAINNRRRQYNTKITLKIQKYIVTSIISLTFLKVNKIVEEVKKIFKTKISRSSVYRILKNNKITYKKVYQKKNPHIESNKEEVKELMDKLKGKDIISVDESHIVLDTYLPYGWSKRGERIEKIVKKINNNRYSLLMAIDKRKIMGYKLLKGSVNGIIFKKFIEDLKINGKHVLLDNARIHHTKEFKKMSTDNQIDLIYNVAYNPETNPIEMVFSMLKRKIKENKNDTQMDIEKTIKQFSKSICSKTLENIYNRSHKFE